MKKSMLSLALALLLMLCATVPAVAADVTVTDETTQSATLTYAVAQSFTVTIPDTVTISGEGRTGTGIISIADSIIPFGESLTVTITAATNYDTGFRLKDGTNENYIGYTIKNGEIPVTKDTAFLTVAAGTASGSATLTYTADAPTKAGNYTDGLTFTVAAEVVGG